MSVNISTFTYARSAVKRSWFRDFQEPLPVSSLPCFLIYIYKDLHLYWIRRAISKWWAVPDMSKTRKGQLFSWQALWKTMEGCNTIQVIFYRHEQCPTFMKTWEILVDSKNKSWSELCNTTFLTAFCMSMYRSSWFLVFFEQHCGSISISQFEACLPCQIECILISSNIQVMRKADTMSIPTRYIK